MHAITHIHTQTHVHMHLRQKCIQK